MIRVINGVEYDDDLILWVVCGECNKSFSNHFRPYVPSHGCPGDQTYGRITDGIRFYRFDRDLGRLVKAEDS